MGQKNKALDVCVFLNESFAFLSFTVKEMAQLLFVFGTVKAGFLNILSIL